MKPSLEKLYKFFKLEIERQYDNNAVMGGLERMLDFWEAEARADELPEELIRAVNARIRDYHRLTVNSRAEIIEGLWFRLRRTYPELPSLPAASSNEQSATVSHEPRQPSPADQTPPSGLEKASLVLIKEPEILPTTTEVSPTAEPAALQASVINLDGIGPRTAQSLEKLGIKTLRDMLYHFPRRYDDYSQLTQINRLNYGDEVTVIGTIQNVSSRTIKGGQKKIVEAIIKDGSGSLRATWFNPWVAKRLQSGKQVSLAGKIDKYLGRLIMNNPELEQLEDQQLSTNRIVPVYPSTAQITQRWIRQKMDQIVTFWAPRIIDPLPTELRSDAELMDLQTALLQVHFPDSWEKLEAARHRLAFDEIFLLQLGVLRQKRAWQARAAQIFETDETWLNAQVSRLPFVLTAAQMRALRDVQHDLGSGHPMNRLIQGDVGSGKTVIAALAIAQIVHNGAQAALMAPTSILAEQHYMTLRNILTAKNLLGDAGGSPPAPLIEDDHICLMIGSTPEVEKAQIRAALQEDQIKIVVGTHALIEDPVRFANLQLVIIDEQHRFGVEQRAALRAKGDNPHLLVTTATPIPRSLALTVYGDLDLTVMDEMPPGRKPVSTHVLMPLERERAYTLVRGQIQQGRQAFIIYPLVEESDASQAKAAVEEHARLQEEVFPDLNVGLLHGRMRPDEKDAIMTQFRQGQLNVLVSTSVIEVGVDVPNATVMLIEGANRFGLAQLHQFRGRVGRGADNAYCVLIPDTADQAENERLQVMVETNDGFVLAERDLEQRGPGEFLGTRQAGYADLHLANLTNVRLIEKARRNAQILFEKDPDMQRDEHQILAATLQQAWGGGKGDIS